MRPQTLRSYTTNNLEKYLRTYNIKQKRVSTLLRLSQKDSRVAELSQAFFFAQEKMDTGNLFATYTDEEYKSSDEFLKSNNKFVYLFNGKKRSATAYKMLLKKKLLNKKEQQGYSYYKMAKLLETSQSNVDLFFKKDQHNKMSVSQLIKLDDKL